MQNNIQLNKELIHILQIPNVLYSTYSLRKKLSLILKKKTYGVYYISNELQQFLSQPNDFISLDNLIDIIIINYSENTNKPNCDYYSYDQKPNFDLFT
jgi:hypothetical protein